MLWQQLRRLGALVALMVAAAVARLSGRAKRYGILKLTISGELTEGDSGPRVWSLFRRGTEDYFGLLSLLHWARDDSRLRGVLVSLDGVQVGWARAQGLRRALLAVRAAGKRVWVHLSHGGLREYLIASGAERIVLSPSGGLEVAGLSAEATFFLGALEKLGVQAEVIQIGQYKSAAESLLRRDMSAAHREMIEALVDDLYEQVADAVGEARRMSPDTARELLGRGPFVAPEALQLGLVDAVSYLDEVEEEIKAECGGKVIDKAGYGRQRGRQVRRQMLRGNNGPIALLQVSGSVKSGPSIPGPEGASATGAATVVAELDRLRDRDDVPAIVMRVTSPGGSGLASDLIWRAVSRVRDKKPVVMSLGDVAASGGYYIAAAGAPVLAEAGTITGSIGVLAGKANLRGLYDHLGITKEIVSRGQHAALYSDYVPLGSAERERLETHARRFYTEFVSKVAAGRQVATEAIAAVAEGRVWTGRQALARGLIDRIGGIEEAVGEAKALAGIPADAPVAVETFPRPRRFWRVSLRLAPAEGQAGVLAPWLALLRDERVWAVLPFHLRFF